MKPIALLVLAYSLTGPAGATAQTVTPYQCNDQHYVNVDGQSVHSPSCGGEPDPQTAVCRDGSVSHSKHHSGTCSRHGGVAQWSGQ